MLGSNQPWTKICLITILPKLLVADRRSLKLNWKKKNIEKNMQTQLHVPHKTLPDISTFSAGTENVSQMAKCTVHLKFSPFYISVENMDGNRKWGLSGELFLVHFSCWWFAELWTVDILQAKQSGGLPCLPLCGDQPTNEDIMPCGRNMSQGCFAYNLCHTACTQCAAQPHICNNVQVSAHTRHPGQGIPNFLNVSQSTKKLLKVPSIAILGQIIKSGAFLKK